MPEPTLPVRRLIIAGLLLCGLALAAFLLRDFFVQPVADLPEPPPAGGPPADVAAEELLSLNTLGLALLENGLNDRAVEKFGEAVTARRASSVGLQNLLVALLLQLKETPPAEAATRSQLAEQARQVLADMEDVPGERLPRLILAARLERETGHPAAAVQLLQQADRKMQLKLPPEDRAALQYELARAADEAEQTQVASAALAQAWQAAPENMHLILELLLVQAQEQDAAIAQTLDQAKTVLEPWAADIEERTRANVISLLDAALQATEQPNWPVVLRNVRIVSNVVRPEELTQSDRLKVDRNLLEFVVPDFPPEFYEAEKLSRLPAGTPAEIQLVPLDLPPNLADGRSILAAAVTDFDLDQRPDLIILRPGRLEMYPGQSRPEAEADPQEESAASPFAAEPAVTVEVPEGIEHFQLADLDGDADPAIREKFGLCQSADEDVILYGPAGIRLLKNTVNDTGSRELVPFEKPNETTGLEDISPVSQLALLDFDHDGDLDLITTGGGRTTLLASRGNGTFADVSSRSVLPPAGLKPVKLIAVDWDRDNDLDLLIMAGPEAPEGVEPAPGQGRSGWLENLRHGRMRWQPFPDDQPTLQNVTGAALLDADANASWDLLVSYDDGKHASGHYLVRTHTPAAGRVRWLDVQKLESQIPPQLGSPARLQLADLDNDGLQDLLSTSLHSSTGKSYGAISHGRGAGFEGDDRLSHSLAAAVEDDHSRVLLPADIDSDGDLDIVLAGEKGLRILRNEGGNAGGWLQVRLLGEQQKGEQTSASGRVNHAGLGSLIEVRHGATYQARVVTGPVTHFGLGSDGPADVARVLWTNGIPQNVIHPEPQTVVCEKQSLKGSCPYLYTWNGERFVFATDLLWSSPIGLQTPAGTLMPGRDEEYLSLSSNLLQPAGDEYHVQVTEELWEVALFDLVELIAVDHPAEVEIFTNEKVGLRPGTPLELYAVREKFPPVRAVDSSGRNQLPQLLQADDVYARPFRQRRKQGLTEPHYLELEFAPLAEPPEEDDRLLLFLTGWVFPTDTSINVQLFQNPTEPGPRPPALHVPDVAAEGGWREALPFIGFPGGKTKTIGVDVTGVVDTANPQLRLATSMELYWDTAFLAVVPPADRATSGEAKLAAPAGTRLQPLEMISADLHTRGVSRPIPHPGDGPERYDYADVRTLPAWPAIRGRFTSFGDVAELLRHADDLQAVLGTGDEITVKFRLAEQPLPPGWKRDFLLHNIGWDKDADLNTVYGQTVEPLPFQGMTGYPFAPAETFPQAEAHQQFEARYQVREQNDSAFRNLLRHPELMRELRVKQK